MRLPREAGGTITPAASAAATPAAQARRTLTLVACTLVFFVITLDAVIVNVALPGIRGELGGGIGDQQWIVDGYTLMFAALLLSCGSFSDRIGAKRLLLAGMALFVLASIGCGLAPNMPVLILARFVQGSAAAAMMPASMALLNHAYPVPKDRTRAIATWAMGGAVASTSGPVLGGLLTMASWRLIFFINVPVGLMGLCLILQSIATSRHTAPVDWAGQVTGVLAMTGLTFGMIEAGKAGFNAPQVICALVTAAAAAIAFVTIQFRVPNPLVPPDLFRSRNASISVMIGFAFMVGYYGLPFVMSLTLQQHRGLSALDTGLVFLPMMLTGLCLTPFTPRISERIGQKALIVTGLVSMAITSILLNSVPTHRGGIASGVFNTSRQIGGALAIAAFGLLLNSMSSPSGVALSLITAAVVAILTAGVAMTLITQEHAAQP